MNEQPAEGASEHDVTLIVPGDTETIRQHLPDAVERLGYRVLSEQPLVARRKERGWGLWLANLLDQRITLTINLKPASERATRVTFDYVVGNPILTHGDQQTLEREAEAIVASLKARTQSTTCPACGIEVVADSRFCRKCGAPLAMAETPELEVLRLTTGGRGAHQTIVFGALMLVILGLCLLPLPFISSAKTEHLLMGIGGFFGLLGWTSLAFGIRRLHRTLNPTDDDRTLPGEPRRLLTSSHTMPWPPPQVPASVTESTTELLASEPNASPELIPQRGRETAS